MPGLVKSASARAVGEKWEDIANKHNAHIEDVDELQTIALDELLPSVLSEVGLQDDGQAEKRVRELLKDKGLLFRFFRRSRYSNSTALDMLNATITWRLRTDLDSLSLASLHPLYASPPQGRPPLFWCNSQSYDRYGRPLGVISLQSLERVTHDDGQAGLEECREYIVGCMESVRRFLAVQYAQAASRAKARTIDVDRVREEQQAEEEGGEPTYRAPPLQMVIIFSLQSSGMANLELELLPFLLDLLKNHFPGMVGAVYILHFGWVHSGMWALAKRILPQQALARIFFPSAKELGEHFDLNHLPVVFGGEQEIELNDDTNEVMHKYARPHWQSRISRSSSRATDNKAKLSEKEKAEAAKDKGQDDGEEEEDDSGAEVNSAPPSPRGLSGSNTPLHGGNSRTPRSMSRVGSFDSLVDEFYSVHNSPHLSRSATPRTSRPTTPHSEMNGFGFTSAHDSASHGLRLTPSAVNKLQRLQMTRGSRSRTTSDAVQPLDADGLAARSPVASRGVSPERNRRSRTSSIQGGLATTSMRTKNSVRFDQTRNEEGTGGLGITGAGTSRSGRADSPIQRVGSLRDFRLHLDDLAQADVGIEGTDSGASSPADGGGSDRDGDDSDHSGKAGERTDVRKQQAEVPSRARRFFSLLRRRQSSATDAVDRDGSANIDDKNMPSSISYSTSMKMSTADTLATLPPEPMMPDSPRLQVPDIEEPPLSEMTPLFSRRARKYDLPGHVGPYNSANPFYGYPAYPVKSLTSNSAGDDNKSNANLAAGGNDPRRRYHFRRRKRDLVRTLIYLFVLRLLALHRHVRAALMITYRGMIRAISVGGLTFDDEQDQASALQQRQQYQRYAQLRNAGSQFRSSTSAASLVEPRPSVKRSPSSSMQPNVVQRPKPQPLVALGFRKRYALLMIIVAFTLLRREWQLRKRL